MIGIMLTYQYLVIVWTALAMIYGSCTKTSRSLYNHTFKTIGRLMFFGIGLSYVIIGVGLFIGMLLDDEVKGSDGWKKDMEDFLPNGPWRHIIHS